MLKINRQRLIEAELHKHGSILISDLSRQLKCSEETIRRDLKELESQKKLERIHGGAFLPEQYDKGIPIKLREAFFPKEKKRLAVSALTYIRENDVLMLDSSTTCLKLVEEILAAKLSVTIITNSLRICETCNNSLSPVNLLCLGGELNKKDSAFCGYKTTDAIRAHVADKCFISCPSVDFDFGLEDNNLNSAMVRQSMIEHSRQRFLVVDHTKFQSKSDVIFSDISNINILITDKELSEEWAKKCNQLNIMVAYC